MAKKVIVYSTQTCPWCFRAKDFLKENGIAFEEKDVGQDEEAAQDMINKTGQMGVPVIEVDGEMVVGFNEARLRELLGIED